MKKGGALLATYDSGLYNEKGELRQDGGALRDILGVDMKGEAPEPRADTFYRITQSHPALGEYHEGKIVMADAKLMPIIPRPGATVVAEGINLDFQKTLGPAIVVNQYGRGRVVYVAGSLEAQYAATRVISLQRMLASMVRYLRADAPMPFSLAAPARSLRNTPPRPRRGPGALGLRQCGFQRRYRRPHAAGFSAGPECGGQGSDAGRTTTEIGRVVAREPNRGVYDGGRVCRHYAPCRAHRGGRAFEFCLAGMRLRRYPDRESEAPVEVEL